MDKKNKQLKPKDAPQKHECICWDKEKGCKCLSRGYASPCICCRVHNKKLPVSSSHYKDQQEEYISRVIWIQSHYPNRFFCKDPMSIRPLVPYESDYNRGWHPSGALRANGQEILAAQSDQYD